MRIVVTDCFLYCPIFIDQFFCSFPVPDGFLPTGISSQDWCIESVYNNVDMDLLIMRSTEQIWVTNKLQAATQLVLPVEKIAELALGQQYSLEIHDVSLDMHPGRLGVAIKLTIGDEKKVSLACVVKVILLIF